MDRLGKDGSIAQRLKDPLFLDERFSITPLLYLILTLALSYWTLGGTNWEVFFLGLYFATLPNLFQVFFRPIVSWAIALMAVVCLALFAGASGFWFLKAAAIVSALCTLGVFAFGFEVQRRKWLDLVGVLIFVFFNLYFVMSLFSSFASPLNIVEDAILTGIWDMDISMHLSISNMILSEGIPSSGIHLTPYMPYHVLGHAVIALITRLTGRPGFENFYFINPFIVFPVLILLLERVTYLFHRGSGALFVAGIVLFGSVLGAEIGWYNGFDCSFPYSVIVSFLFFVLLEQVPRSNLLLLSAVFLAFPAKITTGMLLTGVRVFHLILEKMPRMRQATWIMATFVAAAIGMYLFLGFDTKGSNAFEWGYLYRLMGASSVPSFIWSYFSLTICFGVITFFAYRRSGTQALQSYRNVFIFLLPALSFAFLAMNMVHEGSSQKAPMLSLQWIMLPVVSSLLCRELREGRGLSKVAAALFLLVWLVPLVSNASSKWAFYRNYQANRDVRLSAYTTLYNQYTGSTLTYEDRKRRFRPYFDALLKVKEMDPRKEYLVHIPASEADFWEHSVYANSRYWMPFYIPAISGRPAWEGYDWKTMKNKPIGGYQAGRYSYFTYFGKDVDEFCSSGKYRGLIVIAKNDLGAVAGIKRECPLQM